MCSLTLFLVFVPGTALDAAWRIKPQARDELAALGLLTLPLMLIVGIACALVAVGLEKSNEWGRRTAIAVLTVDMLGDSINAVFRGDWRTLIRLPIAALMITYLIRTRRSFT